MADYSGSFSYLGTGVQDLFAAHGAAGDAAALDKAAGLEETNAKLASASKDIQHVAAARDIYKVLGGQRSDIAGAGFTLSGSGGDIVRASAQQGAITQSLIETQGQIDIAGHNAAASSLHSQASSARNASKASGFGGLLNIGLGLLTAFI